MRNRGAGSPFLVLDTQCPPDWVRLSSRALVRSASEVSCKDLFNLAFLRGKDPPPPKGPFRGCGKGGGAGGGGGAADGAAQQQSARFVQVGSGGYEDFDRNRGDACRCRNGYIDELIGHETAKDDSLSRAD